MKKLLYVLFILMTAVLFSGCSVSTKQKMMYENDELIAEEGDSYTFLSRIGDTDETESEIRFKRFYGSDTIWNINIKEQGELIFEFDSDVDKGKFKGVLISENKEVTTIFEGDAAGSHKYITNKGKYKFKIVGYNAYGNVSIILKPNSIMEAVPARDN